MTEKIIFVFPGQGAQYVGMGRGMYRDYAVARYTLEQVGDIAHCNIRKISLDGPESELNTPENTSLATFAQSVATARVIEHEFGVPLHAIAYAMAGHSMGQYSALHCVGSLAINDAVRMLAARSAYMTLSNARDAGMAVIVGMDYDKVQYVMRTSGNFGYAEISNHNAVDQFVISGHRPVLQAIVDNAMKNGARMAKMLNVSVPAHCALMQPAADKMRVLVNQIHVDAPKTNWFSNQTGNVMSNPCDVKDALVDQMTHGVRWYDIMQKFPAYNITQAYELGPGTTLSRLIRRAGVGCKAWHTDGGTNLRDVLAAIAKQMSR
ncbi:MAG: ACP S-malonyltransferase [Alphaproteobacteria bacterium]|nr:ACP S-malonyltransferase [Alphaproteobacteria bacterium]MDE6570694.1 ACP S-malonyltransferase [Alphaproteobacteria bacterium]